MCRLLGYAAPVPVTTRSVLSGNQSAVFQDMTQLHKDGWGSAWLAADQHTPGEHSTADALTTVHKQRSPETGAGSLDLTQALAERLSSAQIVHLRMATDGMACHAENTHPFLVDGLAFAHNGSLMPAETIDAFVEPSILAGLRGDTDSERYFAVIRSKIAAGHTLFDAVCDTVAELRPLFPDASMNALILSHDALIAVHASADAEVPHDLFDASGLSEADLPQDHRTAYYLMRQRRLDDGTMIFASSGLDIVGWEPLPAESVTRVDLATLATETRVLSPV
ncbi:class II glutamine amidotransferase [Cryobacterium melibiosiphilum]|nr:class II glutamine amidotransferase [Cryobacterium melibiosiphilum]